MEKMFKMNDVETKKFNEWYGDHTKTCEMKKRGRNRWITYSFTPNGFGISIRISCTCGKGIDVSDIDSW